MKWCLLLICLFTLNSLKAQQLLVSIHNMVNDKPVSLHDSSYINSEGDTFNISTFKYYLSNFSLTDTAGKTIRIPPECFLVSEDSAESQTIVLNVPPGHYKGISFMIGVDSLLNCSGAQSGALDPVYGMFWTWNSGYISAKLEGTSPSSRLPAHMIEFHIGGYRAPHITQRWVTLPLVRVLKIAPPLDYSSMKTWYDEPLYMIHLLADINTLLKGVNFHQMAGFMTPGAAADRIADNYQHMFSVK